MLLQRLLTAAILIPLVIWGDLTASTPILAVVMAVVILLGAWEWRRFAGLSNAAGIGVVAGTAMMMGLLWQGMWSSGMAWPTMLLPALLWWLLAFYWVRHYPRLGWGRSTAVRLMVGAMILLPCWVAVVALHAHGEQGPEYLLYMLVLIWAADSGAYFAGRRWGRRKLAPEVSPGKTIEGLWGALATSMVWAVIGLLWLEPVLPVWFVLLSLVMVLFSVLGDLTESMFKRMVGLKDSGQILPGHGGVLDRIDSLTAAAPVFVLGLMLMDGLQ